MLAQVSNAFLSFTEFNECNTECKNDKPKSIANAKTDFPIVILSVQEAGGGECFAPHLTLSLKRECPKFDLTEYHRKL